MQREGEHHELPVAEFVHDHAAEDDSEAEAAETSPTDQADLKPREAKQARPLGTNAIADAKADASGQNGHEAGPK